MYLNDTYVYLVNKLAFLSKIPIYNIPVHLYANRSVQCGDIHV